MDYSQCKTMRIAIADGIARVTLDNGEINLFDGQMFKEMSQLAGALAEDDSVRVVILHSANPDFFIAHFDVGQILKYAPDREVSTTDLKPFHIMCEAFRTMPKATIAVIEGRVGGGGSELTLSCDMRFALRGKAVFNQPEVALGILPGGSGTVRLPRLIGRSRALEVVLGCDDVDADLAQAWGWVNRSLSAEELWPHVNRLAARIASFPRHAVIAAKASVLNADKAVRDDLMAEGTLFQGTLGGEGTRQAMERFMSGGGQTPQGEGRLGALAGELHKPVYLRRPDCAGAGLSSPVWMSRVGFPGLIVPGYFGSSHALKCGERFSRKALTPSFASGWWSVIAVRAAMSSSACAQVCSAALTIERLSMRIATCGPLANSVAQSIAVACKSASGTTS
jgi:enoyl-CoA hydratase/carnithine racemase